MNRAFTFDVLARQFSAQPFRRHLSLGCLVFLVACGISTVTMAQTRTFRIVTYNIEADINGYTNARPGLISPPSSGNVTNGGVLEGIGEEILNGDPAQPIDILLLEETVSNAITIQPIVNALNAFYGSRTNPAGYATSPYQGTQRGTNGSGNGPNGVVYNTNTVQLVASVGVGTPGGSGNGEYRQEVRYEFAPAGFIPTTNNEFYVYVGHYKSGSADSDMASRNGEAQIVRADSATLPSNARIIYTGDFNTSTSGEAMYQTLVGAGVNAGVDVLNPTGSTTNDWSSNTTNPSILAGLSDSSLYLDYRDDYQLMTSNVLYGAPSGLTYNAATYHTFANNGTVPYNGAINLPSNTALNNDIDTTVGGITSNQLYQYLTTASDHLPVVVDYTMPIPSQYSPQSIQTVFVIVEQNQNWASISGNTAAPYINHTLLPMAAHAEQYFNPPANHPSLPNYLWLEAGTNFGILADGDPSTYHQSTTSHLVTLLNNAGVSWTSYQEDIGGTICPLTATNQYVPQHNPMVYFDDVTSANSTGSTYCIANVRPFTELAGDLQSNVVTRYNFITPNLCDDMTGGAGCPGGSLIAQADTWLSNNIPRIMSSQAYSNNGTIFITWDEGVGGDGPIGMILLSPLAKRGAYSNTVHYTHSSTLLTMQEIFNVGPLLGDAANAIDLSDLFTFGAQMAVSPASGFTPSGFVGGPFMSNLVYTLTNTGGVAMVWSATNTVNWLTLSPTNGSLAGSVSTNISISVNANANALFAGSYSDTVVFATSNGSGTTTRPVNLSVITPFGQLSVSPLSGYISAGSPGGPFYPVSQTYTVSNTGNAPLNWTANNSAAWLTLSPTSGSLAAGASTNVTATINANANSLAVSNYSDTIGFTNVTYGAGNTTRAVTLGVSNFGFYDDFSTFSSGALVGQHSWTQLGTISSSALLITNGQVGFTGGLTNNAQTAYKNFALTNETVFYGMTLTVTNAPNTNGVPYFATFYTGANGSGASQFRLAAAAPDAAMTNYALGIRVTVNPSDPYTFGTGLSYGTQYRVIIRAASGTNATIYVNPTSGDIGAQTPYAANAINGITTVGSVAISQLDNGTIPSTGGLIGKFVVADNFGTAYVDLLPAPPTASFTANPTNGTATLTVAFTDTSLGSPTSWAWTFGDGGTSTAQNPNYAYTVPGTYTVTLIASNAGGSTTSTQTNLITVLTPPPVASFFASPTSGPAPLDVTFTDTSSGSPTSWAWTFGDGGTSTDQHPGYSYVTPGTYTVTLIASNVGGSSTNIQSNYITAWTTFQSWQNQYFGSTTNSLAAPAADPLGKGISNSNQFLMGLDPTNPASTFRIISVVKTGTDVVVTWRTSGGDASGLYGSGKTNVLAVTPGLPGGSYTNNFISTGVTNIITTVGDVITNAVDTGGATNRPSRFYQIQFISP